VGCLAPPRGFRIGAQAFLPLVVRHQFPSTWDQGARDDHRGIDAAGTHETRGVAPRPEKPWEQTAKRGTTRQLQDLLDSIRGRGSLTIWFTDVAVAAWKVEPRTTRGG
jgi:hypothetical protein